MSRNASFRVVAFGGVFLDANSTAEVSESLEGFDIQHSYLIPSADHCTAPTRTKVSGRVPYLGVHN
jgi:hypothetical protein